MIYALEAAMPFGKHKAKRILDVARKDPRYLWWLHETSSVFKLDEETLMFLDYHLALERDKKNGNA